MLGIKNFYSWRDTCSSGAVTAHTAINKQIASLGYRRLGIGIETQEIDSILDRARDTEG